MVSESKQNLPASHNMQKVPAVSAPPFDGRQKMIERTTGSMAGEGLPPCNPVTPNNLESIDSLEGLVMKHAEYLSGPPDQDIASVYSLWLRTEMDLGGHGGLEASSGRYPSGHGAGAGDDVQSSSEAGAIG